MNFYSPTYKAPLDSASFLFFLALIAKIQLLFLMFCEKDKLLFVFLSSVPTCTFHGVLVGNSYNETLIDRSAAGVATESPSSVRFDEVVLYYTIISTCHSTP